MASEIIIYKTPNGETNIDVRIEDKSVWLTQKQLGELYQTSKQNISKHLIKIFKDEELDEKSVVNFFLTTASDGKAYPTLHFAALQAHMRKPMRMIDWESKLNDFLTINDREILLDAGKISRKLADEMAGKEYDKYSAKRRRIEAIENFKELEDKFKQIE